MKLCSSAGTFADQKKSDELDCVWLFPVEISSEGAATAARERVRAGGVSLG